MRRAFYLLVLVFFVSCSGNDIVNPVIADFGKPTTSFNNKKGGGQYTWNHIDMLKSDSIKRMIDKAVGCLPVEKDRNSNTMMYYNWESTDFKVTFQFRKDNVGKDIENSSVILTVFRLDN